MRPGTTQPGRYTLQALVDAATTNAHGFSGAAAADGARRWSAGNDTVLAGSVALAADASNPNPLVERHYAQRNTHTVVRATIIADVARPTDNATLAVLVAKTLANAGLGVPYGPISQGFMGARVSEPLYAATLSIAPWRRPAARPAPARPAAGPTQPAPAPPLPPTPPVPLTPLQRLEAGPVEDSTEPARVGATQAVVSREALYEAAAGGEWWTLAAAALVVILLGAAVVVAVGGDGE